jgi:hypothetical protein
MQTTAQTASTAAATPVSGARSTSVAHLPPSRSASLSQATTTSASSGPRPKKKKKTLDFAHLFKIDIAGSQQRQGSVPTPPNSAPPITVKKEELAAAVSEQALQNVVPSRSAQGQRSASSTPGTAIVGPLREASVPGQAESINTPTGSFGAQVRPSDTLCSCLYLTLRKARDASEVQIIYHSVPSASPSVEATVQEVAIKTEEPPSATLRLAESPQPLHAVEASTQSVGIPDVSVHQQPLVDVVKLALSEQPPTLEDAGIETAPTDNTPEELSEVSLPEKEPDAALTRQDAGAMDIGPPPVVVPPTQVSHLQLPAMQRTISAASTSVSMDLESVSDDQPLQVQSRKQTSEPAPQEFLSRAPVSLQQQPGFPPHRDTNQKSQGDTLPGIEDAMDVDQPSAPGYSPSQSPSPAPSDSTSLRFLLVVYVPDSKGW